MCIAISHGIGLRHRVLRSLRSSSGKSSNENVSSVVVSHDAFVSHFQRSNRTPLLEASRGGVLELVKCLIDANADVNLGDKGVSLCSCDANSVLYLDMLGCFSCRIYVSFIDLLNCISSLSFQSLCLSPSISLYCLNFLPLSYSHYLVVTCLGVLGAFYAADA